MTKYYDQISLPISYVVLIMLWYYIIMSVAHGPLHQFAVTPIINIVVFGYDLSFTNASLFMVFALILAFVLFTLPMRNATIVPSRIQGVVEGFYEFIDTTIMDTIGEKGRVYLPFIFSIFIFVLTCNLLGMLPYGFTVTSHITVTLSLALLIFVIINIIAFWQHGLKFFSLFLPSGTPLWIAPLMILIEVLTYFARPITLAIRLSINMLAGHVLMKVIAGFAILMGLLWAWLPVTFIVALTILEIFVAILQAYVFTILTCVYLNDAINLH